MIEIYLKIDNGDFELITFDDEDDCMEYLGILKEFKGSIWVLYFESETEDKFQPIVVNSIDLMCTIISLMCIGQFDRFGILQFENYSKAYDFCIHLSTEKPIHFRPSHIHFKAFIWDMLNISYKEKKEKFFDMMPRASLNNLISDLENEFEYVKTKSICNVPKIEIMISKLKNIQ